MKKKQKNIVYILENINADKGFKFAQNCRNKIYEMTDKEQKAKEYRKQYYQKNKNKRITYQKEYYEKNKEKINARIKANRLQKAQAKGEK